MLSTQVGQPAEAVPSARELLTHALAARTTSRNTRSVRQLAARVEAVLDLHSPSDGRGCKECETLGPCRTWRRLNGEKP